MTSEGTKRGTPSDIPGLPIFAPFSPEGVERLLRTEWWLNHGHAGHALYGDDGEMQCSQCPADFKRSDLAFLYRKIMVTRARAAS